MIKGPNIELGGSWMKEDGPSQPGIFLAVWDGYVYVHIGSLTLTLILTLCAWNLSYWLLL